jgi:DNA-binding transcriptional LysR family regulator
VLLVDIWTDTSRKRGFGPNGCAKIRSDGDVTLDWDDIRFFLAVFRAGTLLGASQALGVDHSTVSRRIDRLERMLKARLFNRRITGYEPTRAGELLMPTAEQMESAALTAKDDLGDQDLSLAGVVRIGAPDGFGSMYLAPRLRLLCDVHPGLQVELVATARNFSLTKREADIAFSLTTPTQGRVIVRKLTDYGLGLYGSAEYLKSSAPIAIIKDLRHHHFIGYIEDLLFTPELNYLPLVAKNIVPRFRSGNLVAQLHACLAGSGLAVLPAFMTPTFPQLQRVLPNAVALKRTFFLQMHEDSRRISLIRETANFIVKQVQADRRLFQLK